MGSHKSCFRSLHVSFKNEFSARWWEINMLLENREKNAKTYHTMLLELNFTFFLLGTFKSYGFNLCNLKQNCVGSVNLVIFNYIQGNRICNFITLQNWSSGLAWARQVAGRW